MSFEIEEVHFVLASGKEEAPIFLAADYEGALQLTARPHMAQFWKSQTAADSGLEEFLNHPLCKGESWRVMKLRIACTGHSV